MAGYTYDPRLLNEFGRDRMRFELGDTMVEGREKTAALTDEEIDVILSRYIMPKQWKTAKLDLLESICRRFAYEPEMKEGPISFSFGERAILWREDYLRLKKEVSRAAVSTGAVQSNASGNPPYFYNGMMNNRT